MGYRILMGYIVGDSWDMMKYHEISKMIKQMEGFLTHGGYPKSCKSC